MSVPTEPSVYGEIVSLARVRKSALEVLQTWVPAYLAEVERQDSLPQGSLPQPRSWSMPPDVLALPGNLTPTVMVAPPVVDNVERLGKGEQRATIRLTIGAVIAAGPDLDETGMVLARYLTALLALVGQQRIEVSDRLAEPMSVESSLVQTERGAGLGMGSVNVGVSVPSMFTARGGPSEPPSNVYAEPDDHPVVEETAIEIERG